MKKILKNLKIAVIIGLIFVLVIISTFSIGYMGFKNMTMLDRSLIEMYNTHLIPISQISDMKENLLLIRVNANKSLLNYNSVNANAIDDNTFMFKSIMDEYKKSKNLDDVELKSLDQIKKLLDDYTTQWSGMKNYLENKQLPPENDLKNFDTTGYTLSSYLKNLSDYSIAQANEIQKNTNSIYIKSVKTFWIISGLILFIILVLALSLIILLRNFKNKLINTLSTVSDGDLSVIFESNSSNEFGIIGKQFNKTIKKVSDMLKSIKDNFNIINTHSENLSAISEEMSSSSVEVASTISNIADGSLTQSDELSVITDIMNNFSINIESIVTSIEELSDDNSNIQGVTKESSQGLNNLSTSINEIKDSFSEIKIKISELVNNMSKINEITSLIDSIADQTNLLALNAAIEAARAGEAGRGFAVVADEIRKLAEQSKDSSGNISKLVSSIKSDSTETIKTAGEVDNQLIKQIEVISSSLDAFKNIINLINMRLPKVEHIKNSALDIKTQKDSIVEKVAHAKTVAESASASSTEIAASSQQMNASSEEVAATSQSLNELTRSMMGQLNQFKL